MTDSCEKWRQNFRDLQAELLWSGVFRDEALRELRADPDVRSTLAWVSRQDAKIIVVDTPQGRAYPSFQFGLSGDLRNELAPHVATLQNAGYSPWLTWAWLVRRSALLSGDVPAQVLLDNPKRAARAVQRHAACARPAPRHD